MTSTKASAEKKARKGNRTASGEDYSLATPEIASVEDSMVVDLTGPADISKETAGVKRRSRVNEDLDLKLGQQDKKAKTLTAGKMKGLKAEGGPSVGIPGKKTLEFSGVVSESTCGEDGTRIKGLPGHVKKIELVDFMCHEHMTMEFSPHVTFISGKNGSGKSASLQALQCCLGVNATKHGKNASLAKLIRTGADEAIMRVTIWNQGTEDYEAYRPDLYGDLITIERRITKKSHSWSFKSAENKVISRKKDELEHILHALGLNASNPVTVMTQNTARGLLGSTTSKADQEKYELYMDATQLGTIAENLAVTKHCLSQMSEDVEKIQEEYGRLEGRVSDAQSRRDRLLRLEDLNQEMQDLEIVFAMEIVLEQEKRRDELKSKLERDVVVALAKAESEIREKEAYLEGLKQRREGNNQLVNDLVDKVTGMKAARDEMTKELKEFKKQIMRCEMKMDRYNNMIEEELGKKADSLAALEALKSDKVDVSAMNKMKEHVEMLRKAKDSRANALEAVARLTKFKDNAADELGKLQNRLTELDRRKGSIKRGKGAIERNLESLKSKDSKLAEFGGRNLVRAVARIEEAQRQRHFSMPPIGPIGQHLGLKHPSHARAIESAIGSHLNTFLVANRADLDKLRAIFSQCDMSGKDMPRISIANLSRTATYEIPKSRIPDCTTVLSVLTCENGVVSNYLVDMARIESVALCPNENVKECAALARNPLVHVAFDPAGKRYTHRGNSLAFEGNDKRYQSRAPRIGVSQEDKINMLKMDLQQADQELRDTTLEEANLRKEYDKTEEDLHAYTAQLRDASEKADIEKTNFEILESTQALPEPTQQDDDPADEFTTAIAQADANILHNESKVDDAKMELETWRKKLSVSEERREAVINDMKSFEATNTTLIDSVKAVSEEIQMLEEHILNVKNHEKSLEGKRDEWIHEVDQIEANIQAYLPDALEIAQSRENAAEKKQNLMQKYKAHGMNDEDIEKTFTRSMLEKKLSRVTNVIDEAQKEAGGSLDAVEEQLLKAREELKKEGSSMRQILDMFKSLKFGYEKREKKLQEVDDNVERIVSHKFRYYLKKKGHFGKIRVNRKERKLEIGVRIGEKSQAPGSGIIKDLKQLSGGERSFATVAFALALGGETDMPFRAMDEFDVFMDSVNRRIAMENLLSFAKENPDLQFIFLTPQDITALYAAREQCRKQGLEIPESFIRVVSMKPPRPATNS